MLICATLFVALPAPASSQDDPSPPQLPPQDEAEAQQEPSSEPQQPPPDETADQRADTVPEEGEEASSDRIRYRDPLDIDYEPLRTKWERFTDSLLGLSRYSFFDGDLRFRIGMRFQADGTLVDPSGGLESSFGEISDDASFRRFRFFAEGILRRMYFRAEFDLAADPGFKSAYLEGREGGLAIWDHLLGKFRYGYFQEPFSLEQSMSSFDTTFAEVSMPIATMAPGSTLGAMVYDASKDRRFTWAFGAFSWGQDNADNASTSLLSLSSRLGYSPVRYNDGRRMLRLGASLSTRNPTGSEQRYEARPEARFVRPFADTGDIPASNNFLWGLEAAWKSGSAWAQAEWIQSRLDSVQTEDPRFDGLAIQVGAFLTGQSRPWDDLFGVWGRVRPDNPYVWGRSPFRKDSGGAWEVAARYSSIDLSDGLVDGGEVRDLTAGVNWYLSTTSKIQANWVYSKVKDVGHANIWILRYQFAIR